MSYDARLYDGSDPLYAPGLNRSGNCAYWKAPKKYINAGWSLKSVALEGDDVARALRCRELTREMIQWWEGSTAKVDPDTWQWLFSAYKGDKLSPIQEVKGNTRAHYLSDISYWEEAVGEDDLSNATYAEIKGWLAAMRENGRSDAFIHRKIGMLRIVISYGCALENKQCQRIKSILSEIRVKNSRPRKQAPTRAQVYAVIAAADAAGDAAFALGIMLQYEFALRAVDIRGQWIAAGKDEGGIQRGGKRWQDGLTWDMIDRDVTRIIKTISKTERHSMDDMEFDLSLVPAARERLMAAPMESRIGPVIVNRFGEPYHNRSWAAMWREHAETAKVPFEIQLRDCRAGAITEAKDLGADMTSLRDFAGHSTSAMTERYARGRSASATRVVELRQVGTKAKPA